ncbi:trypsin beta-like [Anopheles bellator]|uniref:trypsin beta-like n=1 Tax=Anopheles bellator TaxID=139047 RepID=UPI0026476E3B|nr:trypsin beta-like [Anopheles bellator]
MKVCFVLAVLVVSGSAGPSARFRFNRRVPEPYESPEWTPWIVGGTDANIANYPYQLSLQRRDGGHFCGASIIAAQWALSAAHCTFPAPAPSTLQLRGGSSDRTQGGVVFDIDQIVNHPNYNEATIQIDVCVLHTTSVMSGLHITPVALDPSGATHTPGTRAVVSGWGLNADRGSPIILQRVDIPIISDAACMAAWPGFFSPDMLCANEPGRDACSMDSGGPLVVGGTQIGIVSWGNPSCLGTVPGGYARVAYPTIRSFILEVTGV